MGEDGNGRLVDCESNATEDSVGHGEKNLGRLK
jgi:hypothetical protein